MLCDVPIVDRSIRVTRGEDLDVSGSVTNVSLAIVDVVLVKSVASRRN